MIAALDADVICLQEVLFAHRRREPSNQAAWLAAELGYHHGLNQNWRRQNRIGGDATLSRSPAATIDLLADHEEHPFALATVHELGGERFVVINAHFLPMSGPLPAAMLWSMVRRWQQVRQVVSWLRAQSLPCIVAGDLNALPYTLEYWTLRRCLMDCSRATTINHRNTRPTFGLPAQLDYIFASRHFQPRGCRTLDVDFSDHRPVVADLDLRSPALRGAKVQGGAPRGTASNGAVYGSDGRF